jgi:hypothetical protein
LYQTGIDFDSLSFRALINAQRALQSNNIPSAEKYLHDYYTYTLLSAKSFNAAAEFFDNALQAGEILAEGIRNGCQAAVKFGLAFVNPTAAKAADYIYIASDFVVDYILRGEEDALKDAIVKVAITGLLSEVHIEAFGGRTIADYIENRIGKVTFPILQEAFNSEQIQFALSRIIKEAGVDITGEIADEIASKILDELTNALSLEQAEAKSPVELRAYDSEGNLVGLINGQVEHKITRSIYNSGTITILFTSGSYKYQVSGTGEGSYGLELTRTEGEQSTIFTATDIPITSGAVHQYNIDDWDALAEGDEAVTVDVDSDGDGIIDYTFTSDSELTGDEFLPRSGCFIATAAYGTPMAEEIQILHEFRDEYLLTNPLGKGLVEFYYMVSPPIAKFINEHPSLKPVVRAGLLPAVAMSTIAINTTPAEKAAIIGFLVLASVVVAIWVMRWRGREPDYTRG